MRSTHILRYKLVLLLATLACNMPSYWIRTIALVRTWQLDQVGNDSIQCLNGGEFFKKVVRRRRRSRVIMVPADLSNLKSLIRSNGREDIHHTNFTRMEVGNTNMANNGIGLTEGAVSIKVELRIERSRR